MPVNPEKMGEQIRALRNSKGITQNELGERLNVAFQTVSKWERGECLPDTAILPDLANVLETTVDNILMGGERLTGYTRRVTVAEAAEGIACFERIGELLGKDSYFYIGAIEGCDRKMNIDLLSASAHKFSGPKGAGFLYVNEDVKLPPLIAGGAQEQGRRAGTENVPAIAGMAAAVNKMTCNMDINLTRRRQLDDYFISRLHSLNAGLAADKGRMISLNCCGAVYTDADRGTGSQGSGLRLPGTFSMTIPGFEAEELIVRLSMKGICISAGAACASSADEGSHVLAAVGLDRKSVRSSVRITMNENNTEEEIDRLFEELSALVYRTQAF